MKRKLMLLMTCLMIGIGLVNAQVRKVTGTVTSAEDGLPVVGASVLVKGTTVGTVTDIDGNFTISNVPSSAGTLVVSFIGLETQELEIKPVMKVVLHSDTEVLDEVVVTAYGTATKGTFTGSASVMKADTIKSKNVRCLILRMHWRARLQVCKFRVQTVSRVRMRRYVSVV